jgi:hypothetical protein
MIDPALLPPKAMVDANVLVSSGFGWCLSGFRRAFVRR